METLAIKLSELLDITFKGAMDLLPILQKEFAWYKLGEMLIYSWIPLILLGFGYFLIMIAKEDTIGLTEEEEHKALQKITTRTGLVIGIGCPLYFIGKIIQIFLSPTILMILELKRGF